MGLGQTILIIILVILVIFLWKWLKPYFIRYDTTAVFTGGLGSGKTLEATKAGRAQIIMIRFKKYYCANFFNKIARFIKKLINYLKANHKKEFRAKTKHLVAWEYNQFLHDYNYRYFFNPKKKKNKKYYILKKYRTKPMLYANYPIHFKSHVFGRKREWAKIITPEHIFLIKKIKEYSKECIAIYVLFS